jgi:hypothetical protein
VKIGFRGLGTIGNGMMPHFLKVGYGFIILLFIGGGAPELQPPFALLPQCRAAEY